jgi:hypothetical protein
MGSALVQGVSRRSALVSNLAEAPHTSNSLGGAETVPSQYPFPLSIARRNEIGSRPAPGGSWARRRVVGSRGREASRQVSQSPAAGQARRGPAKLMQLPLGREERDQFAPGLTADVKVETWARCSNGLGEPGGTQSGRDLGRARIQARGESFGGRLRNQPRVFCRSAIFWLARPGRTPSFAASAAASRDTASRLRFSMAGILAVVSQSIVGAKPLSQSRSISRHSIDRIGHVLSAAGKKKKNLGHWSTEIGDVRSKIGRCPAR